MVSTRKRLVLHIGFHQAGSAAVHESLFAARVGLRDHRVVYPQPLSGEPSHLDLATALGFNPRDELGHFDRRSVIERYRRLIDDAAPGSTIVIASDEFCLGNYLPDAMENLRIFRDKLDVTLTVSAAVRDPLAFLIDIYQLEVRSTDLSKDFSEWVEAFDLTGADFGRRLAVWEPVIGPSDELAVRDVDEFGGHEIDRLALDAVLDDCGLGRGAVALVRPPRDALHPRMLEPLLAVRRHIDDASERQRLLEALIDISALLEPVGDAVAVHLDPTARAAIRARLAAADIAPPFHAEAETSRGTDGAGHSTRSDQGINERQT